MSVDQHIVQQHLRFGNDPNNENSLSTNSVNSEVFVKHCCGC